MKAWERKRWVVHKLFSFTFLAFFIQSIEIYTLNVCVRQSVGPSVRQSVGPSVRLSVALFFTDTPAPCRRDISLHCSVPARPSIYPPTIPGVASRLRKDFPSILPQSLSGPFFVALCPDHCLTLSSRRLSSGRGVCVQTF